MNNDNIQGTDEIEELYQVFEKYNSKENDYSEAKDNFIGIFNKMLEMKYGDEDGIVDNSRLKGLIEQYTAISNNGHLSDI